MKWSESMQELRCGCNPNQNNLLAKYSDTKVEIKCKHGKIIVLEVVNGKLVKI